MPSPETSRQLSNSRYVLQARIEPVDRELDRLVHQEEEKIRVAVKKIRFDL